MADPHPKLSEVAWQELFPWLVLARSIRIALSVRVLVLGAIGIIALTMGWRVIGIVFPVNEDPVIQAWRPLANRWVWDNSPEFAIAMSARSASEIFLSASEGLAEAPVTLWVHLTRPFVDMFRGDLTPLGFLHLLLCCIWELLVWGLIGGAITRIAALKFARDEALGFTESLRQAAAKLWSYCAAPLIALAGAAVFAVQLMLLGLLMHVDLLAMLVALAWPFVLLLGLLMAILLIGALVGWPLMWATVSVEGTDAFDALSRSYAYVYQRPLRLLWYVFFAALLAALSMFVVKAFAASAIALGDWSISWGLDRETMAEVVVPPGAVRDLPQLPPPAEATIPPATADAVAGDKELAETAAKRAPRLLEKVARRAIFFWKSLLAALAAGYQAGFLWVSAVGVYLLLRRDIDGAEMDEVFIEQEADRGLPVLKEDATTGVPEVTPGSSTVPGDTGRSDQSLPVPP
ncbi:MAG: hypothetical protein L0Z07_05865 [Planctomycetes bacterium]|nr:hypothetical protein [Planctomycetota bacterium]